MLGLYVHIPFCDKICKYCDFAKVQSDVSNHRQYLEALAVEYDLYRQEYNGNLQFDTIYFGGGTPSALSAADLVYLLNLFEDVLAGAAEITFEANPESLSAEKIAILKQYGVNRVSLGVQTFNERRLRFLNRGHTNQEVEDVIRVLRQAGIDNINLDLMYALPQQTEAELQDDVRKLLALAPSHISTYALIFEPHTTFYLQLEQNKLQETDEAVQASMYQMLQEAFTAAGFEQYEFSNWAKPGLWSRHNTKYWDLTEYLGIGLGAHGFHQGVRYANTRSIVNYQNELKEKKVKPRVEAHTLTRKEQMEETLFLGLRMTEGVSKARFAETFGQPIEEIFGAALREQVATGNLLESATHYRLAPAAFFISNEVLSQFLLEDMEE